MTANVGEGLGKEELLGEPLEVSVDVSQKLKTELPCEPAMLLLNIHPTECKLMYPRDGHTSMFMPLYSC